MKKIEIEVRKRNINMELENKYEEIRLKIRNNEDKEMKA